METVKIDNFDAESVTLFGQKFREVKGQLDSPPRLTYLGIDPGVNFGITHINMYGEVYIWHGKLKKDKEQPRIIYGIHAYELARTLVGELRVAVVAVEGAAYNAKYGQVGLAEVRFGFYFGAHSVEESEVYVVSPKGAKKVGFGSGKTDAKNIWPLLNGNAADSIGLALAATHL